MTQGHHDPAETWSRQLDRLAGVRRDAVVAALRHSAETGWPASQDAVELLVRYALGEISARDYAAGIVGTLGIVTDRDAARDAEPVRAAGEPPPTHTRAPEAAPRPTVSREDAVQAYVTGQIPVGEFLRIARG